MDLIGMDVEDLDTPQLIVDLDRLERNILAWQDMARARGVNLRPHVKTHKIPAIARMQLDAGASGITVAKVAEAEVFAGQGCRDLFIAYPVIGADKWRRGARLAEHCRLIVGVDSEVGARGWSEAACAGGVRVEVRVEVDTGMHRSGVAPDETEALARLVASLPGLRLSGIFTFRSIFFAGAKGRSAADVGRDEGEQLAALAQRLRALGLAATEVSVGSSPTAAHAAKVPGVTEVRPGTYVFCDYMMAELGVCSYDDIALSILCTVVSRPAPDRCTVDGGTKTFSGDVYPGSLGVQGYARAVHAQAYLESMSEEHGVVRLGAGVDPRVGEKMAFFPLHVCTTVNLSDQVIGVRRGRVETVWPVAARGGRT